jgi:hypothetical protein
MSIEVTLVIPDEIYRQAKLLAVANGQDVADVLVDAIDLEQITPKNGGHLAGDDQERFFGMWADMTEEENKLFDEIIASRKNYAPRTLTNFFGEESHWCRLAF